MVPKEIKEVVDYIVKSLVDNPKNVVIKEKVDNDKVIFEIHVDKEDLGKVIGKSGKTIRSIRGVVGLLSADRNLFIDIFR